MDKALKKKWVKALRSGDYEQTTCALRVGDGFCCLGVLADIQGATWKHDGSGRDVYEAWFGPLRVSSIGSVHTRSGEATGQELGGLSCVAANLLTRMNDVLNKDFEEIADAIEKYF